MDFTQAFDKVWRTGLWSKILSYNINGKIFQVIFNMYKNIKPCVFANGQISSSFPCETGVRQGENLSPVLFSIFLNDLELHLRTNGSTGISLSSDFNETI